MTHGDEENVIHNEDENVELMDEDVGEDVEFQDEDVELQDEDVGEDVELAGEDEEKEYRPYLTLDFPSQDEAYNFYNRYAKFKGFSIKKFSTARSKKSNEVIGRTFCCSAEGVRNTQENTATQKKKLRANTEPDAKPG